MSDSLWCERYKPSEISSIIREDVRNQVNIVKKSYMNTVIGGMRGVGKSTIADTLVSEIHNESQTDYITINISNIFNMTKNQISSDDRFSNIVDQSLSKKDMIHSIIKNLSAYKTVSGGFRTIVLDNFESARDDFQNFLRRIIEKYTDSTQFIFVTREPLSMIEAIQSRCYSFNVRPMTIDEFETAVEKISIGEENFSFNSKAVSYLWSDARPNLRYALLILQETHTNYKDFNINNIKSTIRELSKKQDIQNIINLADNGDYQAVLSEAREIIGEQGVTTDRLIKMIVDECSTELNSNEYAQISQIASDVDVDISESTNKPIEIVRLFAEFNQHKSEYR